MRKITAHLLVTMTETLAVGKRCLSCTNFTASCLSLISCCNSSGLSLDMRLSISGKSCTRTWSKMTILVPSEGMEKKIYRHTFFRLCNCSSAAKRVLENCHVTVFLRRESFANTYSHTTHFFHLGARVAGTKSSDFFVLAQVCGPQGAPIIARLSPR